MTGNEEFLKWEPLAASTIKFFSKEGSLMYGEISKYNIQHHTLLHGHKHELFILRNSTFSTNVHGTLI